MVKNQAIIDKRIPDLSGSRIVYEAFLKSLSIVN